MPGDISENFSSAKFLDSKLKIDFTSSWSISSFSKDFFNSKLITLTTVSEFLLVPFIVIWLPLKLIFVFDNFYNN